MSVLTVDTRGLEPPEPFTLAMDALADLAPGDELRVLLDRVPYPLLRLLERDGYPHHYFTADDGSVEVRIGDTSDVVGQRAIWPAAQMAHGPQRLQDEELLHAGVVESRAASG